MVYSSNKMRSSSNIRGSWAALLLFACVMPCLQAQSDAKANQPHPAAEATKRIVDQLSDEEKQGLRAAVNEIWHVDAVEKRRQAMLEANLAYRKALKDEIGKMEVSQKVRTVLLQLLQYRFRQEGGVDGGTVREADERGGAATVRPMDYSPEEREIVTRARLKAENQPEVIAAKRQLDMAVTARERNAASGNYRSVMRASMEEADPRVKRILGKRGRDTRQRPRPGERRKPVER
ncbi:MAG: hypothetical protein ACI9UA_000068 [Pseudoalteromonas tetraodonis]|jgi:hypothetical protein